MVEGLDRMTRVLAWATLTGKVAKSDLDRAYRDAKPVEIEHPLRLTKRASTEKPDAKPTSDAGRIASFFGAVAYTPKETPSEQ